ncbi:MAG: HlyD family efflux transporter periplasmic adaptor subunit [Rariglobus sp.]
MRASLRYIFQEFGKERCCVIEDPLSSKFHRVGLAEYRFIRQLDGTVTFAEAFARASLESGSDALNEREAIGVLSWLVDNRLADLGGSIPEDRLHSTRERKIKAKLKNVFNFLFIKVPLGRPDEFLSAVYPACRWMCGWGFALLWLITGIAGIGHVAVNWDRFVSSTEGVLAPHNWLWLLLVWAGLKVWHEFWHGLICKHHGGKIREAGVLLMLLTPLGYVDATSSLAFPSKWTRMHVAAAGMFGELFFAAIAAIVWANTAPGITNTLAMNVMVMASAVTVLFNLNPLMRFDGYFLAIDMLEKPNLGTRSNRMVKSLAKRWLLGASDPAPEWGTWDTWLCLGYGVASVIWRILIITTLLAAAALLLKGGGLVFAVIGLIFWIMPMLQGLKDYLAGDRGREKIRWWVAGTRCGLLTVVLMCVCLFPFRLNITTPGVVRYEGEAILRAEGPGFVTGIHTSDGAEAAEGAALVTLSNPELEGMLESLAISHRRQDFKRRMALLEHSTAEYEAEVAMMEALRKQYMQQLRYVETLDILAPRNGRVLAPHLDDLRGQYVKTGDEILRVVNPSAVEAAIPISQDDVDAFRRHLNQPVKVYVEGRSAVWTGRLHRISGRASNAVEHPALTTMAGGPLTVKQSGSAASQRDGGFELVQAYFWGDIALPDSAVRGLKAGERVRIKFRSEEGRSLGNRAKTRFIRFVDHVFASTASL